MTFRNMKKILWISDIPREKGCFCQAWDCDKELESDIWIEVKYWLEPDFHDVPAKCRDWVDLQSIKNKTSRPKLST